MMYDIFDWFVLSELDGIDEKWRQGLCPRCASFDPERQEGNRFFCTTFGWKDHTEKQCAHFRKQRR